MRARERVEVVQIALCPKDSKPMELAIGDLDMQVWWCTSCASHRTLALHRGANAPPDALMPQQVRWVEAPDDPRFGRIDNEEGG